MNKVPLKLQIASGSVGVVLVGIIAYSLFLGAEVATKYAMQIDAVKEIRYETAAARLVYDQWNVTAKHNQIIEEIDAVRMQSEALSQTLLQGGFFKNRKIKAIKDPELRGRLYDVRKKQEAIYEALDDRWKVALSGGDCSGLDPIIEAMYNDFVEATEGLENRLRAVVDEKLAWFKFLQLGLILLTISCVLGFGYVLTQFVTRREAQNKLLRESEKRYRQLLNNARDIVLLIDAESEKIVEVNPQAMSSLGYTADQLRNMTLADLQFQPEMDKMVQEHSPFSTAKERGIWESRFITRMGESFPIEASVGAIEREGKLFWLAIVRDVTIRKGMEHDLVEAKKVAEDANMAKSAFLANMSHEVRTPINGIMGMLQLMETTTLDSEQDDYVSVAINSCRSLTSLLTDILDLSRVEAGKIVIERETFSLNGVLDSVDSIFRKQVNEDGIHLDFHLIGHIPDALIGDGIRLKQILCNLVGNAVKFTENGGVSVRIESLNPSKDAARLLFTVSDTGMGIESSQVEHIFDAFRQVDGSYTRKHQGAGLGLSIVQKLVNLMGGSIELQSEVGIGTTLMFELPFDLASESKEEWTDDCSNDAGLNGKSALIVDDHEINRMSVSQILRKLGIESSCAASGAEALSILQSRSFDFALMDIQMPEMDGLTVTKEIRNQEIYGAQNLPIIAMTAHAMVGDREKFLHSGMDDYIAKPFEIKDLKGSISRVLEKNKPQEDLLQSC